jgi:hypothetical protein
MFGVFLFLTYYLQQTLGYSPVRTGVAFLPLVASLMVASTTASSKLLVRTGPKPLVAAGMLLAAGGMLLLTQLGVGASYATDILPSLLLIGAGLGLVMGPSMNTATYGADPADAGVASAMVSTAQQVGGSIGTALLNTVATSAATHYLAHKAASPSLIVHASVHGDVTAFAVVAVIFAAGAVLGGSVLKGGKVAAPVAGDGAELAVAV